MIDWQRLLAVLGDNIDYVLIECVNPHRHRYLYYNWTGLMDQKGRGIEVEVPTVV